MAATLAQVRLRDLALDARRAPGAAGPDHRPDVQHAPRRAAEPGPLDQRQLWRFGISGDKPIVLVRIQAPSGLPLVNALLRAQPWWTFGGLAVDVVVINSEPNSYLMPLQRDILALRDRLMQTSQNSFPQAQRRRPAFTCCATRKPRPPKKPRWPGWRGSSSRPTAARWKCRWRPCAARPGRCSSQARWPNAAVGPAAVRAGATPNRMPPRHGACRPVRSRQRRILVRTAGRPVAAAALGQCHRQSRLRLSGVGNRQRHDLGRQQPDAPAHAVVQRPGARPGLRALAAAGPRQRPGFPADAFRAGHRRAAAGVCATARAIRCFEGLQGGLQVETTFFADRDDAVKVVQVKVRLDSRRAAGACARVAMVEWQMGDARGRRRTLQTWKAPGPCRPCLPSSRKAATAMAAGPCFWP